MGGWWTGGKSRSAPPDVCLGATTGPVGDGDKLNFPKYKKMTLSLIKREVNNTPVDQKLANLLSTASQQDCLSRARTPRHHQGESKVTAHNITSDLQSNGKKTHSYVQQPEIIQFKA